MAKLHDVEIKRNYRYFLLRGTHLYNNYLTEKILVIIIILCIDNNVVLIFNFLLVSSIDTNPFKALLKNDFNKVQKSIQEMRLPML